MVIETKVIQIWDRLRPEARARLLNQAAVEIANAYVNKEPIDHELEALLKRNLLKPLK